MIMLRSSCLVVEGDCEVVFPNRQQCESEHPPSFSQGSNRTMLKEILVHDPRPDGTCVIVMEHIHYPPSKLDLL